jgi:hypothetical protein
MICAALRLEIAPLLGPAKTDALLGEAAIHVLASHDPGNGIEALTGKLVGLLGEEGELADDLLIGAAMEGEMTFVAQALSRRSGVRAVRVIDELLSGNNQRAMAMLRMSGVPRTMAARLLAGIGDLLGLADPGHAIDTFDGLSGEQIEQAKRWLSADPQYRGAVETLAELHGKRSV